MDENQQAVQDTNADSHISLEEIITEKNTLRKTGNRISLLIILVTVIANVLQFIIVLPFSVNAAMQHKPMDFMQNPLFLQLIMYIPTFIGLFTVILIGRKSLNQKVFSNFGKSKASVRFVAAACLVCIGAGAFGVIFSNLIALLFSHVGVQTGMPNITTPNDLTAKIVNISYLCVIAPIMEETLFRGIILKSLRRYGNIFAIVASSILFGIFHFNLIQLIPATLIGIVLSYIAIKSESIIPSILAHATNNIVNVVFSIVFAGAAQQQMAIYGLINCTFIIVALVIIIIYRKKLKDFNSYESTQMTGKQKVSRFFFHSWGFYILLAIFVINCIFLSLSSSGLVTKVQ